MKRFEEAAQIDEEPFDYKLLDEVYVTPYAQEACMPNAFSILLFRYFEIFDQKYGTEIARFVHINQMIGYSEEWYMEWRIWYDESGNLFRGAMNDTGWNVGAIGAEEFRLSVGNIDKLSEDEAVFQEEYKKFLDGVVRDDFLRDALRREDKLMLEALETMEDGYLAIIWNPELNDYMQFRKEHSDMIEAVCKNEDQWIIKLEEDIWQPYMAFYQQEKEMMGEDAYCKVLVGWGMDSYVSPGSVNPNWICKAVKLNKMLQLANEKLRNFQAGEKVGAA